MDEPILDAEAIDEGLERRAGRAQRLCHVDLARARGIEIVRRGNAREDLAAGVIERQDRDRDHRPERAGAVARQVFEALLQRGVEREAMNAALGRRRDHRVGGVRRQHRHWLASGRHRLEPRPLDLVERHDAGGRDAIEHAVARIARGLDRAVGPAQFGRLRQRDEQRGFREIEAPRLLAEIGERGGADAFEIAAIGREAEIERQDLVFPERALKLDRAHDLAQLGGERALVARLEQTRHLHADGGRARDDAAVQDELRERAAKREHINAGMLRVALVLIGEQDGEEARIDIGARRLKPPAPFRRGVGPQQPAVAVDHHGRIAKLLPARRRAEGEGPPGSGSKEAKHQSSTCDHKGRCATSSATSFPPPLWGRDREGGGPCC